MEQRGPGSNEKEGVVLLLKSNHIQFSVSSALLLYLGL